MAFFLGDFFVEVGGGDGDSDSEGVGRVAVSSSSVLTFSVLAFFAECVSVVVDARLRVDFLGVDFSCFTATSSESLCFASLISALVVASRELVLLGGVAACLLVAVAARVARAMVLKVVKTTSLMCCKVNGFANACE